MAFSLRWRFLYHLVCTEMYCTEEPERPKRFPPAREGFQRWQIALQPCNLSEQEIPENDLKACRIPARLK